MSFIQQVIVVITQRSIVHQDKDGLVMGNALATNARSPIAVPIF